MKLKELYEARSATPFTCLQVAQNILGAKRIATEMKNIKPEQFLVQDVDMGDAQYIPPDAKAEQPNAFRGGEVRPYHLAAFARTLC